MTDRLTHDSTPSKESRPTEGEVGTGDRINLQAALLVCVVVLAIGIHFAGIARERAAARRQFSTDEKLQAFINDELKTSDSAPGIRMVPLKYRSYSAWASNYDFRGYPPTHPLAGEEVVALRVINGPTSPVRVGAGIRTLIDLQRDGTVDVVLDGTISAGGWAMSDYRCDIRRECTAAEQKLYLEILRDPQPSSTVHRGTVEGLLESIRIL